MSHMEWSNDSIVNAITKCQQQRALFIVYVKDESTASSTSDAAWNSREVFDVLSSNPHVAIRLMKDSLEYQQFSQLFPVLLTPCLFCIGNKGEVLETASGAMDPTQLAQLLIRAFQKHNPDSTVVPPTQNESVTNGAVSETRPLKENEETAQSDPLEEQQTDQEEKLASLQEKKQLLRQKKEQEAKEKEKERELRRRKEGQQLEQWKKDKEDLEREQWLKERRKQKLEEERARQEVLAKLEQDKRERAAQRKRLSQQPTEETSDSITTTKGAGPPASNRTYSKTARVQVKMSNGSTTVLSLSSSDTVSTLRQQIAEFLEADIDSFSMTSGYPRTDLTHELDDTPLSDHGLAPSGVVIVKFNNKGGSSFSPSGDGGVLATVWGLFAAVIQFIVMIFKYIKDSIFGSGSGSTSQQSSQRSSINRGSNQRFRKFNQDDFKDDDDEKRKETYNGNSTQQL